MRVVTESLKAAFDRGWGLLDQLIEVCPDSVWNKKAGGFLFWQQLYHCFGCVDYFIAPKDAASDGGPLGVEVIMFKKEPSVAPSKEEVKAFSAKMKSKADTWLDGLDDAALALPHEGFSARRGTTMTNATTLAIMAGHSMYHIGSCDAILRDCGEKSVM